MRRFVFNNYSKNREIIMKQIIWMLGITVSVVMVCGVMFIGCASSENTSKENEQPPQPSATEMMKKQITDLQSENISLRSQVEKFQQDNRTANARIAELETQLGELKERLVSTPTPPPKLKISNTNEAYDHALALFRSRDYREAASTFQSIIDAGAPEGLTDNCVYWLGECAYGSKNYKEAIGYFGQVFTFAKSEKKDDAQIMIANSYFAMGNKTKAKAEYQKLIDKFPASPYVKRAKARLGQL
jgi:TolA-binding protein